MFSSFALFPRLHRDAQLYIWTWGITAFGYFGIFGVLFNLYLLRLGYGPEMVGLLVGSGQLAWGVAAIPAGLVGGRIGNRSALIIGIGIAAFSIALLLCVEVLPLAMRTGWIASWWMISWVGTSLMVVNGTPYFMELTAPEERRTAFSLHQAFMGMFGFAGSVAAGLLPGFFATVTGADFGSSTVYWYALWLMPLCYLTAALLLRNTEAQSHIGEKVESHQQTPMPVFLVVFIALVVFLQTAGEGSVRAFFNVYLDTSLQVPTPRIGLVMGIGQFLPILSSLAAPMLLARWGSGGTVVVTAICSSLFILVLAFLNNWTAASVGYIGVLMAVSIASVARNLFMQEVVDPKWRTVMSVAFTVGISLGWASAAGLGGYLIAAYSYRNFFLLGALLATISGLLLWGYLRWSGRGKLATPVTVFRAP